MEKMLVPQKIIDGTRRNRVGIVVSSLEDLISQAKKIFGIESPVKILLENDGTLVNNENYFKTCERNTCFLILKEDEDFESSKMDSPFIFQNLHEEEILERLKSLENNFVELRLKFNLIILRDGVWRINKKLNRSQYENTPPTVAGSSSKLKKSPKKTDEVKSPPKDNYGLDQLTTTINKKYRLKEGELLNFIDGINTAGSNVAHEAHDNKSGSVSPLKRSYNELIEDAVHMREKRPEFYQANFERRIKMPKIEIFIKMREGFFHCSNNDLSSKT